MQKQLQSAELTSFYFELKQFQRNIISETFFPQKSGLKRIIWNIMMLIDRLVQLIPKLASCKMTRKTDLLFVHFIEVLHQYWVHIQIKRLKSGNFVQSVDVSVIRSIKCIPEEVWGIRPTIIVPRFGNRRWEVCYVTANHTVFHYCEMHFKSQVPFSLQRLMLKFLYNFSF